MRSKPGVAKSKKQGLEAARRQSLGCHRTTTYLHPLRFRRNLQRGHCPHHIAQALRRALVRRAHHSCQQLLQGCWLHVLLHLGERPHHTAQLIGFEPADTRRAADSKRWSNAHSTLRYDRVHGVHNGSPCLRVQGNSTCSLLAAFADALLRVGM